MPIIAKDSPGEFKLPGEGTHLARCVHLIELGTQKSPNFGPTYKIMLGWEIYGEEIEHDGVKLPLIQHKEYTLSLNEKAGLRHHLQSWRGKQFTEDELKGFDLGKLLGQPCMLTLSHKTSGSGKKYANVDAVAKPLRGMDAPPAQNPMLLYELAMGKGGTFNRVPEWIQKKILGCEELKGPASSASPTPSAASQPAAPQSEPEAPGPEEDEVPF